MDEDESHSEDDAVPPIQINDSSNPPPAPSASASVGSALQRNPDGSVVAPKIVPRSKKVRTGWHLTLLVMQNCVGCFQTLGSKKDGSCCRIRFLFRQF
jgi:hypothetical protein